MDKMFIIYQTDFEKFDVEVWEDLKQVSNLTVEGNENLENLIENLERQGYKEEQPDEEYDDLNLGLKGEN